MWADYIQDFYQYFVSYLRSFNILSCILQQLDLRQKVGFFSWVSFLFLDSSTVIEKLLEKLFLRRI